MTERKEFIRRESLPSMVGRVVLGHDARTIREQLEELRRDVAAARAELADLDALLGTLTVAMCGIHTLLRRHFGEPDE